MTPCPTTDAATLSAVLAELRALRTEVATQRPAWGRWLSLEDGARYCGLSVKSLRRAVQAGRLSGHRLVKGKILLDKHEIDGAIKAARDQ